MFSWLLDFIAGRSMFAIGGQLGSVNFKTTEESHKTHDGILSGTKKFEAFASSVIIILPSQVGFPALLWLLTRPLYFP